MEIEAKLREIFAWLASGFNMFFYINLIFPFIKLFKGDLSYEDMPISFILASYLNCLCWYFYGKLIYCDQIKKCNKIGAISNLILIFIYFIYEIKISIIDAILNISIICNGTYAIYRAFTYLVEDDEILGKLCFVSSCIVFFFPSQIIFRVINDKNYNLISIFNAWTSLISFGCWITYGGFTMDIYIIFPNVIGLILSILQIKIYSTYKKKFFAIGERDSTSTLGIENTGNEDDKREETNFNDEEYIISIIKQKEKPVKIVTKFYN